MLNFRVGPFPVTVYPWFFLSAVLLGGNFGFGWQMLAVMMVGVVFTMVRLRQEQFQREIDSGFGNRIETIMSAGMVLLNKSPFMRT